MKSSDVNDHRTAKGRSMHLTRGDILKRDGVYYTILVLSPCGRYARAARSRGKHIGRGADRRQGLAQERL